MTINFIFKKDWTGTNAASPSAPQMSFKKGQYVSGEVVDSGVQDPSNYIIITNAQGQARIPFGGKSYQGENSILESPSAPWLAQSPVDTTPRVETNATTNDYKGFFGPNGMGEKAYLLAIVLILLIVIFLIYRIIKKDKK